MGDGENRLITLTHRTQIRRFTTDLLKIIRTSASKQVLSLSQLPQAYTSTFNKSFTVQDYGVCFLEDLLEGLKHNNSIVVSSCHDNDVILYIQKRKQTIVELEKTSIFAGEAAELLRNAPQYSVLFRKFVRSYHYYFGYQCRLSDYGFSKLTELLEAINGVVEMEQISEENRRIFLSSKVALRIFGEQVQEIIKCFTESSKSMIKVDDLMKFHKTKFGYQMQPQTLGFENIIDALKSAPYVEVNL
jgi:meiosis arrest female protein 1